MRCVFCNDAKTQHVCVCGVCEWGLLTLSSGSLHYVLEDCIKKSLIEIPAVLCAHTQSMENATEHTSLWVKAPALCFPLRFAQVDLPPMAHLNGTRPLTPPCLTVLRVKAFSNFSRALSVAANGGICYCRLIWPPLLTVFLFFFFGTLFLFCSFIMLWFCHLMCFFSCSALEKEIGLFSILSVRWQQYDLETKIPLKLGLRFITNSTYACMFRHDSNSVVHVQLCS